MNNNRHGFTLLEVIIALMLIGLMLQVLLPSIKRMNPRYERDLFVAQVTDLLYAAWQRAIIKQKIHRVLFSFEKRTIAILQAEDTMPGAELTFKPITQFSSTQQITIPTHFKVKQFIIDGVDEMSRFVGGKTTESWIYCMPEGLAQPLIINMIDTRDVVNNKPKQISLVLNPFNGICKYYDSF